MEYKVGKHGERKSAIYFVIIAYFIFWAFLTYILFSVRPPSINELILQIILPIAVFLVLFPIIYHMGKVSYNWDNPTIVRIDDDNGYVMVKEEYPDGYVTENRIYFDSIYKIEIKSDKDAAIYYTRKGVRYRWHIVRRSLTKEERAVSFQILNEIIKRVDRNKVEIVDLRKR